MCVLDSQADAGASCIFSRLHPPVAPAKFRPALWLAIGPMCVIAHSLRGVCVGVSHQPRDLFGCGAAGLWGN